MKRHYYSILSDGKVVPSLESLFQKSGRVLDVPANTGNAVVRESVSTETIPGVSKTSDEGILNSPIEAYEIFPSVTLSTIQRSGLDVLENVLGYSLDWKRPLEETDEVKKLQTVTGYAIEDIVLMLHKPYEQIPEDLQKAILRI